MNFFVEISSVDNWFIPPISLCSWLSNFIITLSNMTSSSLDHVIFICILVKFYLFFPSRHLCIKLFGNTKSRVGDNLFLFNPNLYIFNLNLSFCNHCFLYLSVVDIHIFFFRFTPLPDSLLAKAASSTTSNTSVDAREQVCSE